MAGEEPKGKQVVGVVCGWLSIFDDGSVDRRWTGPPEFLPVMEPVPPYDSPRDGITVHDLAGDPAVRLYLPQPPSPNADVSAPLLPVLLHFHGGGFCISHASWLMYHHFYARLARAIPATVVSVELPLAPEHRLPAAIDAGYRALLWLRSLALLPPAEQDPVVGRLISAADFTRVFLIGDSSGGNLVHHVAARAGTAEEFWPPVRVAGGVLLHPGFVRASRSRSEIEIQPESVFLTLEMVDKFLALGLPEGATKDHPYTCPMGKAAPPLEEVGLPPFMVAVAERDLMRDTNLEYCEAMKRAGKDVEVVVSAGVEHAFYLNKLAVESEPIARKRTEELIEAIKSFVNRH